MLRTTSSLNNFQAGGAECTPRRPESGDGSALNGEMQPKGAAGGPESTEFRLLKVKVHMADGPEFFSECFFHMTETFY